MEPRSSCYCCVRLPLTHSSRMDIDTALNELGMLSSVTESRRQFMRERDLFLQRRASRERVFSEPSDSPNYCHSRGSDYDTISETLSTSLQTPTNSPSKSGAYQILQLNTQYVTGVSTCGSSRNEGEGCEPIPLELPTSSGGLELPTTSLGSPWADYGHKYNNDSVFQETRTSRLAKSKLASRVRRFKKPYDLPWRHSIESYYNDPSANMTTLMCTPEKAARPADKPLCSSNSSSPEKTPLASSQANTTVPRSKSLDDLDFAKLRLAEAENHNLILEKREIDRVSQHLKDLHVGE